MHLDRFDFQDETDGLLAVVAHSTIVSHPEAQEHRRVALHLFVMKTEGDRPTWENDGFGCGNTVLEV